LIRRVFEFLEEKLDEDVVQVNLVIQGSSVMVQRGEEEIIDLLHNGQGVLNILPMAGVKEDLDAKIVELFPGADETSVGIEDDGQAIAQ